MNSGRNDRQRISRRVVLTGAALALGATATVVSQTAAQVKISPATANYQGTPKGTSAARAALTSNRRMRANSSKATSVRTAGVSCLSRRRRPSPGKAAGVSLGAALIAAGRGLRSARCITLRRARP